jgi:hypothetical protein
MTLSDFFNSVGYKISGGDKFCWDCFGYNAYTIDASGDLAPEYSASVTFDTETQLVYTVEVWDTDNNREYRWINPAFVLSYKNESIRRSVDYTISTDDRKYIDIEVEQDILEKVKAIVSGEHYDTRIQVPLDLPRNEMLRLMTLAHEQDITFNQLIINILEDAIKEKAQND